MFDCRIPYLFAAFAWREWKGGVGALSLLCGAPTPQLMERGKGEIRDSLAKRGEGDPGGQKIRRRSLKRQNIAQMKLLKSVRSKQIQCSFSLVK